ncbi:uncharacterized protein LOC125728154 isoform X2 [Brienomyrus brachyistius]|uniref:uncharacterized protein LOC125728154 isoform X2 n=1 Tax=Brienomyrus brachyistius TaxID=42636 RepID=UPI0020B2EEB5|nr:uncharacterized protein LOC125728154 isoform X2 [Brienomyrus brachyistius]
MMMLWAAKDTGRVEAVVGPYKLYDHSFRTLQGNEWLSDEVIDAYVHYILEKQQKPIHQMCAVVATSLFTGKFRTLMKMKFPVVEKWACPVNVGAHWILLVVDIPLKKIILIDPFGNEASYERRILRNWRNFMKQRGDDENRATWTVATLQHNKQRDGSSCGVLILKFAEHLLSEGDISRVQTTSDFVTNARLEIACSLLEYQGKALDYCVICSMMEGDADKTLIEMVQCDHCNRWAHFQCANFDPKNQFAFICTKCL